jgi:hypothetical protein
VVARIRSAVPGRAGGSGGMPPRYRLGLEHILFVRPDVAAVKVRQLYQTPDGPDVGTPLWIMAKEDGRWLLTACQNTSAPDDELPSTATSRPIFPNGE